ncbi:MAG: hypothetical protein WCS52_01955 [bacterium]
MIATAQGTPNYKAGYAIMDVFSKVWNKRYWETDPLPLITTSKYFSELKKGDNVKVTNEPTIVFHDDYEDGQDLEEDPVELDGIDVTIDKGGYFNVPLTDVQAELSHLALSDQFMETALKEAMKKINTKFFIAMKDAAIAANKGVAAGALFSGYNLGTADAPAAVNFGGTNTATAIVQYLTQFTAVLREQYANEETFMVIPPWMEWVLVNSEMKSTMVMGDGPSRLINGYRGKINNMNVIVSGYLPGNGSAVGTPTAILGGNKAAIGFTLKNIRTNKWYNGKFKTLLQGEYIWGWKAVKPQAIVNGYAYFKAAA